MSDKNVINFEEAKARLESNAKFDVIDTHDAVLDVSDVIFTTDELVEGMEITDDYIIVKLDDQDDSQSYV